MERSISITNPNGALFVPDVVYHMFPNTKHGKGKNNNLVYRKSTTDKEEEPNSTIHTSHVERNICIRGRLKEESADDAGFEISSNNKECSPIGFDAKTTNKGSKSKTLDYERDDGLGTFHDRVRKSSNKVKRGTLEKGDGDNIWDKEKKIREYIFNEVDETFKLLDVKGNMVLDKQEIKSAYLSMGQNISDEEAGFIIEGMANQEDENLSYEDFVIGMYGEMERGVTDDDLKFLFDMVDSDKDGYIQPCDIGLMFQKCGEIVSHNEACGIIEELDLDDDGLINFEEFKKFYRRIDEYGRLTNNFWPYGLIVSSSSAVPEEASGLNPGSSN